MIVFAILAIAPVLGVRFWEIWQDRTTAIAEAKQNVVQLAGRAAEQQAELIEDTQLLLNVMKGVPALRDIAEPACNAQIRSFRDSRPWIEDIGIADETGTVLCAANPGAIGVHVADRPYYAVAWSNYDFTVSDLVVSRASHRPTLVAALPYVTNFGERLTFLSTLELSWLDDIAARVARDLDGDVVVVDKSGNVVAGHLGNASEPMPDNIGLRLDELADARPGQGQVHTDIGGGLLVGYAPVPGTSARIFVAIPNENVVSAVRAQTVTAIRDLTLTFAALVIIALIGGEFLLLRPIRNLDQATRRIADGDYRTRAEVDVGPAEFRKLGKTFNVMVDRLEALADMDPMTGLANRRQLDRHLRDLWQRLPNVPIAVAMIDVDHFKPYNDFYGHVRGDKCLQAIAHVVKTFARRSDDLAARFGGEEFTLVAPGMSATEMVVHCDRLREAIESLAIPQTDSVGGVVTVSAGVVVATPLRCPDMELPIRQADRALYAAKTAGRNRVCPFEDDPSFRVLRTVTAS